MAGDGLASEMEASVAMLGDLAEVLSSILSSGGATPPSGREQELVGDLRRRLAA